MADVPYSLKLEIPWQMRQKLDYLAELDNRSVNDIIVAALRLWAVNKRSKDEGTTNTD